MSGEEELVALVTGATCRRGVGRAIAAALTRFLCGSDGYWIGGDVSMTNSGEVRRAAN